MFGHPRTRAERYKVLTDDKNAFGWAFWHLQLERMNCEERGDTESLWYSLVCTAIDARRLSDYATYNRTMERLGDCLNEQEWAEVEKMRREDA